MGIEKCSKCGKADTKYYLVDHSFVCASNCYEGPKMDVSGALLHQNAGNPYKPWLTKAGNDILTYRVASREDGKTIIDRRTGKETPFVTRD